MITKPHVTTLILSIFFICSSALAEFSSLGLVENISYQTVASNASCDYRLRYRRNYPGKTYFDYAVTSLQFQDYGQAANPYGPNYQLISKLGIQELGVVKQLQTDLARFKLLPLHAPSAELVLILYPGTNPLAPYKILLGIRVLVKNETTSSGWSEMFQQISTADVYLLQDCSRISK